MDTTEEIVEQVAYKDGTIAMHKGGWIAMRNGKRVGTVMSTKKQAQEVIDGSRKTLLQKIARKVQMTRNLGKFATESTEINNRLDEILAEKLEFLKMHVAVELDEARIKIIKARVRGGKVQRRKKVSNVKGYTLRGGKLTRMSNRERMKRKLSQRKGKLKRKAKMARALMKRKRSLRKRASLGL